MCGKRGLILLGPLYLSRQNYNNRTQIGKKVCMTLAEPESYCYMRIYRRKLAISYKHNGVKPFLNEFIFWLFLNAFMCNFRKDPLPKIGRVLFHNRRFQEYFNHMHIFIGSCTLQILQFWYQHSVNILFLVVKSIEVTSAMRTKSSKNIHI